MDLARCTAGSDKGLYRCHEASVYKLLRGCGSGGGSCPCEDPSAVDMQIVVSGVSSCACVGLTFDGITRYYTIPDINGTYVLSWLNSYPYPTCTWYVALGIAATEYTDASCTTPTGNSQNIAAFVMFDIDGKWKVWIQSDYISGGSEIAWFEMFRWGSSASWDCSAAR